MMEEALAFFRETVTWQGFLFLAMGTFFIGMDKAGLRGGTIIAVPLFAGIFEGRVSAAIVLPLLLVGDVWSLWHYRKSLRLSFLGKMLPPALAGLAAAMVLGNVIPDRTFRLVMAVLVLICLLLMVVREFGNKDMTLPDHPLAHGIGGFSGGFTAMIGNAAGPIMAIYLLSLGLPKDVFIGVGALFFFCTNLLKIPVHSLLWGSMTFRSLFISLVFIPFVFLGILVGLRIVRRIPDRPFRVFIMLATLAGTLRLFFN